MPFSLLKKKKIHESRVFRLDLETWKTPEGKKILRDTVVHPGAVGILPEAADGKILMIKQFRPAVRETLLEIPAGTLEAGEQPLACAKRELREETGFAAREWKKLGSIFTAPGFCSEEIHLFWAKNLKHAPLPGDEDEAIEVVAMTWKEIWRAVEKGKIQDAKTLSALMHAVRLQYVFE